MTHEILWNGTAGTPWGRMLFAPESTVIVRVVKPVELRSHTDRVRAVRSKFTGWFTSAEMVQATGVHIDSISTALNQLRRRGEIERERKQVMRGRINGETRQRYKWVTR